MQLTVPNKAVAALAAAITMTLAAAPAHAQYHERSKPKTHPASNEIGIKNDVDVDASGTGIAAIDSTITNGNTLDGTLTSTSAATVETGDVKNYNTINGGDTRSSAYNGGNRSDTDVDLGVGVGVHNNIDAGDTHVRTGDTNLEIDQGETHFHEGDDLSSTTLNNTDKSVTELSSTTTVTPTNTTTTSVKDESRVTFEDNSVRTSETIVEAPPVQVPHMNLGASFPTETAINIPGLVQSVCMPHNDSRGGAAGSGGAWGFSLQFGEGGNEGLVERLRDSGVVTVKNGDTSAITASVEFNCATETYEALRQIDAEQSLILYTGQNAVNMQVRAAETALTAAYNTSLEHGCSVSESMLANPTTVGSTSLAIFSGPVDFRCDQMSNRTPVPATVAVERTFTDTKTVCPAGTPMEGKSPLIKADGSATCDNSGTMSGGPG